VLFRSSQDTASTLARSLPRPRRTQSLSRRGPRFACCPDGIDPTLPTQLTTAAISEILLRVPWKTVKPGPADRMGGAERAAI